MSACRKVKSQVNENHRRQAKNLFSGYYKITLHSTTYIYAKKKLLLTSGAKWLSFIIINKIFCFRNLSKRDLNKLVESADNLLVKLYFFRVIFAWKFGGKQANLFYLL